MTGTCCRRSRRGAAAVRVEVRFAGLSRGAWRPARRVVERAAARIAAAAGTGPVDISLLLTGDEEIRRLNRRWRRRDRATDVLAFGPPPSGLRLPGVRRRFLGDIVVSLDTCRRQARALDEPALRRLAHLLAHGVLHLLGHKHRSRRSFAVMERRARCLAVRALQ